MEKLIYPMKTVAISQLEFSGGTHKNIPAIDMRGEDNGIDYGRACCTCKVLGYNTSTNVMFFGSCDSNGNQAKVLCADGKERVITFALTHANDISKYNKIGKIYKQKEICYTEGVKGKATGNHIHMEICEGWQSTKKYYTINGVKEWTFDPKIALKPTDVLWLEKGYHTILGGWKEFTPHWYEVEEVKGIYINAYKGSLGVRKDLSFNILKKTNAELLKVIPKGEDAKVLEFVDGIQKDGYQWLKVEYKGVVGYSQLDSAYYYLHS